MARHLAGARATSTEARRSRFTAILREIESLQKRLDELWLKVARLEAELEHDPPLPARKGLPAPPPAWRVEVRPDARGFSTVLINTEPEFCLPAKLARLLELLAAAGSCEEDGLVAWKPVDKLRTALGDKAAGPLSPGALKQLVLRLRRALARRKLPAAWIEWDGQERAYRFALWKKGSGPLSLGNRMLH
jgi:hypothetical protein